MAKITKIKAGESSSKKEEDSAPTITRKKIVLRDKKAEEEKRKELRDKEKAVRGDVKKVDKTAKNGKKPFILFRPFVALWHYLKDSWHELRQVRWPNRKTTWKMVLAVLVYTALFVLLISLLDLFFTWLFSLILSK